MISDSPPDRELEWTDEGIQSSKNLVNRIERYFSNPSDNLVEKSNTLIEKFVHEIERNIKGFYLNKCIANIYSLFNHLEKNKIYLFNHELSKKILVCIYPIIPRTSSKIYKKLFDANLSTNQWPNVDLSLIEDNQINLPIQIMGKFVTTISTTKDYNEKEILKSILLLDKIKSKLEGKEIKKVINVQNKIINVIIS